MEGRAVLLGCPELNSLKKGIYRSKLGLCWIAHDSLEEISRIKYVITTLTEQINNLNVSGSYTASNCDELHAFQSTGGKVIGNMNVIVGNKIKELNSNGINVNIYDDK